MPKRRAEPDADALIAALLEQLRNTNRWHEVFVKRWVTILRENGVPDEDIADALDIARTTVTRRFGPLRKPKADH